MLITKKQHGPDDSTGGIKLTQTCVYSIFLSYLLASIFLFCPFIISYARVGVLHSHRSALVDSRNMQDVDELLFSFLGNNQQLVGEVNAPQGGT